MMDHTARRAAGVRGGERDTDEPVSANEEGKEQRRSDFASIKTTSGAYGMPASYNYASLQKGGVDVVSCPCPLPKTWYVA
jgi:hypothetical protein